MSGVGTLCERILPSLLVGISTNRFISLRDRLTIKINYHNQPNLMQKIPLEVSQREDCVCHFRGSISASQLPLQFWSYLVIVVLEFAAAVHHGTLITPALIPNLVAWISMLCVGSIVYSCLATLKDSREQTYASGDDDAVKINGASRTASRTLEIHEKEC